MNKTRKHTTATTSSDPVVLSGNHPKVKVNTGQITRISTPVPEVSAIWKPYSIGRSSEKDSEAWYSLTQDLLHTFDEITKLFRIELQQKSWLNAYLLAAGMDQMVEDYLHSKHQFVLKTGTYLGKIPAPLGGLLVKSKRYFANLWTMVNDRDQSLSKLIKWQLKLADLLDRLASVIVSMDSPKEVAIDQLIADGGTLMAYAPYFPATLRENIIKLPSCFRSFDQRPEDLRRVAEEFALHWPEHEKPIMVMGVRTSGSYLAPIYTALLREMGYRDVVTHTIRPGTPLLKGELSEIGDFGKDNGLVLLCDDPPMSGKTLTKAAYMIEEAGIPRRNIVLLLQLFGNYDSLPDSLQNYPSVLLSWSNWGIHHRLELNRVKEALANACVPSFEISELERLPFLEGAEKREHMRALYHLNLVNRTTGQAYTCTVQVEGAGLGYFGEHAVAVAQILPHYSAKIITQKDALLFQEISAHAQPVALSMLTNEDHLIDHMVNYVVERNQHLPAVDDKSVKLRGRQAVWEIASILLSHAFGPASLPIRMALIDAYIKKQLTAAHPSIIDGDLSLQHWYYQQTEEKPFIKTYLADRDFSHLDMWCYDPVYDLAGLALEVDPAIQSSRIKESYEAASRDRILPENWMLYQLVHLWDFVRQGDEKTGDAKRRMAQVVQRYFSEIYFHDLDKVSDGRLCAIDIDGVLESNVMGFPSLSPASARSLRALNQHGFRVIIATGRSLDELKERCDAYLLNGGIAEYGSVIFDQASGQSKVLLTDEEQATLYKVRGRLSNKRGIYLDNDYRYAIRAYCLDENGNRTHLSDESVEEVLLETDKADEVYAIQGLSQTDFMVKRVDKGYGIREWLQNYDEASQHDQEFQGKEKPLALAVGDSATDLPMLNLASLPYAPANASWEVKQLEIPITSGSYQRGLEQAVTKLLGHRPGSCPVCENQALPAQTRFIQDIFAAQENGYVGMLWQTVKLFARSGERFHVGT